MNWFSIYGRNRQDLIRNVRYRMLLRGLTITVRWSLQCWPGQKLWGKSLITDHGPLKIIFICSKRSGYITDWFIFSWPINGRNVHNYTSCRTLSHCHTLIPRILELWMILNFPENLPQLDLSVLHAYSMVCNKRRIAFKSIQTVHRLQLPLTLSCRRYTTV